MSHRMMAVLSLATCLPTTAALAVSVKNLDQTEHKLTVIEGSSLSELTVGPGGSLDGICVNGCLIRLNGEADDPYELEGTEVTTIEKGQLWGEDQEPPVPAFDGEPEP